MSMSVGGRRLDMSSATVASFEVATFSPTPAPAQSAAPTTPSPTVTFSPTISEKKSDEDDDSQPLVIGLSAGVPAGVLFILASLYFMKRRSDAKKKKAAGEL